MKNDRMRSAWAAMATALLVLLALEIAWDRFSFLSENFKNSHFLALSAPAPAPTPEALEIGEVMTGGSEAPAEDGAKAHTTRAQVRSLFSDLQQGKRSSLHIAYFADSITEGDVITEVLRRDLQHDFGGKGVGFQGMAPRDATYKDSFIHRPSKEWVRADLHDWRKDHGIPLGINGEAYRLSPGSASARLRLEQLPSAAQPWYDRATLYWGKGDLGMDAAGAHFDLKGESDFNAFPIPLSPQARLDLSFSTGPHTWLYGVRLDSPQGLGLDNFTFRGNAGDALQDLAPAMLQQCQKALGYDLVLLHFGINALHHGETDFHWYRAMLRKSFEHFKQNLPGAKIVVVSVMDHAERVDGEIVSDTSLPYVLAAQQAAAKDSGLWFINLYAMMGGQGVMRSWVEAKEPLANKDYTHPNRRGGARLAKYLETALLGEKPPQFAQEPHVP
jgi:hypothetical protein